MRKPWLLMPLLIAGCGDFADNDKALSTLNLGTVFASCFPSHGLNDLGGGTLSGSASDLYEVSHVYAVSGKTPLPPGAAHQLVSGLAAQLSAAGATIKRVGELSQIGKQLEGAQVQFSLKGSRGVVVLHYVTVDKPDVVGHLSAEIYEFR